ncbi:hypothetical protein DACRYDRAFT_112585 [Dacryopinax primogenitus]|uniref:Uncharacterized protein n=1 Tax=Dacryopinax primogenitus (strain DJM 731) TaxID=1858805 RepID=M5FN11_DACPD|nr:uncharacterized protein DACRYDRAFT_112585 [Dacryopinax primogenitus]EJT96635.1 hypothetical protein DACRYDRAFT_112585 [Dacryopinax primogenitus]
MLHTARREGGRAREAPDHRHRRALAIFGFSPSQLLERLSLIDPPTPSHRPTPRKHMCNFLLSRSPYRDCLLLSHSLHFQTSELLSRCPRAQRHGWEYCGSVKRVEVVGRTLAGGCEDCERKKGQAGSAGQRPTLTDSDFEQEDFMKSLTTYITQTLFSPSSTPCESVYDHPCLLAIQQP